MSEKQYTLDLMQEEAEVVSKRIESLVQQKPVVVAYVRLVLMEVMVRKLLDEVANEESIQKIADAIGEDLREFMASRISVGSVMAK